MSCFKRYNLVTEKELAQIKWSTQEIIGENGSDVGQE